MNCDGAALLFAHVAQAMNFIASSLFGVPLGTTKKSAVRSCWFHWIATGLLSRFLALHARPFHISDIVTSPEPISSCDFAPPGQNTSWSLIVSSFLIARGMSSG